MIATHLSFHRIHHIKLDKTIRERNKVNKRGRKKKRKKDNK